MHLFESDNTGITAVTTDTVNLPMLADYSIGLDVLRLDKIHPVVSGNKWFKLKNYLRETLAAGQQGLITCGGAYSNHIVATAYAANTAGLKSTGIIRGEKPKVLSHTLQDAIDYGMQLEFISREDYKNKNYDRPIEQYPHYRFIPEGGAGENGIKGCREIMELIPHHHYTHILCAIGTATMYTGIAGSILPHQHIIGIPVLKGMESLPDQLQSLLPAAVLNHQCYFLYDYHFGGYAHKNDELFRFMNNFYQQTNILTDFVYTGKLFFAILDLVAKKYFPPNSKLLAIHSGGLQGNASLPKQTLVFSE